MYYYHSFEDGNLGPVSYGYLHKSETLTNAIKGCRNDMNKNNHSMGYILKSPSDYMIYTKDYASRVDDDRYKFRRSLIVGTIVDESHYRDPVKKFIYYPKNSKKGYPIRSDGTIVKR